jgi:hypothetical protein
VVSVNRDEVFGLAFPDKNAILRLDLGANKDTFCNMFDCVTVGELFASQGPCFFIHTKHVLAVVRGCYYELVPLGGYRRMKSSRTAVCLVVAAALTPTSVPAATTADLQSEMIAVLQEIVDIQQRIIAMLQAQVAQLELRVSSLLTESDVTPAQTVITQVASTPAPTQIASNPTPARSPYPGIDGPGSCPIPSNYLVTTGKYLSRADGNLITIMEPGKNAPSSLPVTSEMFSAIGNVPPGTRLTFFSKYSGEGLPAWSSAQVLSIYCIELAP